MEWTNLCKAIFDIANTVVNATRAYKNGSHRSGLADAARMVFEPGDQVGDMRGFEHDSSVCFARIEPGLGVSVWRA